MPTVTFCNELNDDKIGYPSYVPRATHRFTFDYGKSSQQLLVIGDFNMITSNPILSSYIENNCMYSLLKTPTCFESRPGRCIDLMLTNMKHSFVQSRDWLKVSHSRLASVSAIILFIPSRHTKLPQRRIQFRDYRNFTKENFEADLSSAIAEKSPPHDLQEFEKLLMKPLESMLPSKAQLSGETTNPT